MRQLEKRGERRAREQQARVLRLLAERLDEQLRGVRVEVEQSEIRLVGRNLVKRWLSETGLRFVAGMVK